MGDLLWRGLKGSMGKKNESKVWYQFVFWIKRGKVRPWEWIKVEGGLGRCWVFFFGLKQGIESPFFFALFLQAEAAAGLYSNPLGVDFIC